MCIFKKKKEQASSISLLNTRRIQAIRRIDSMIKVWEPRYLIGMEFNTEEINAHITELNKDTLDKLSSVSQTMKDVVCSLADGVVLDKIEKELDVIDKYYRNEASLTIINDSANDIWKCVQSWANR